MYVCVASASHSEDTGNVVDIISELSSDDYPLLKGPSRPLHTSDFGPPLAGIFLSSFVIKLRCFLSPNKRATCVLSPSASTIVFRVLFCALLATSVGQSVMLTTLPSMGRQANLSEFHIATIMSSSALIFAFGTNVWSKVAKRAGFKRILMVGLSGYSLGTFAFASAWMAGFSGIISGTNLFLALLISRSSNQPLCPQLRLCGRLRRRHQYAPK